MENMGTKEKYVFKCGRWLAKDEDDGETVREIPAEGPGIKQPLPGMYIYPQHSYHTSHSTHHSTPITTPHKCGRWLAKDEDE